MDAVMNFFGKYDAVACDRVGQIDWKTASNAVLFSWAASQVAAYKSGSDAEKAAIRPRLIAIGVECEYRRRLQRDNGITAGDVGYVAFARVAQDVAAPTLGMVEIIEGANNRE